MCLFFHKWDKFSEIKIKEYFKTVFSDDSCYIPIRNYRVQEYYQECYCLKCGKYKKVIVDIIEIRKKS